METIEHVVDNLKELLTQWCEPSLIKPQNYGFDPHVPFVSFEVAQNAQNQTVVRVKVRHDPFGYATHVEERTYNAVSLIDRERLETQLVNALTWNGSPYYLKAYLTNNSKKKSKYQYLTYRWRFEKRRELMG